MFKELFTESKIYDEDIESEANAMGSDSWESSAAVSGSGKIKDVKIVYKKSGKTSPMKLKRNSNLDKEAEDNEFIYIELKPKGEDFIIKEIAGNLKTKFKKNQKLTRTDLIEILKDQEI